MSSWSQTPNGITGVFYGRRCDVVRRGGAGRGTGSAFRANVEGIDEGDLRNKGYARDYQEGKQICFDALAAAGLIPPKSAPNSPGSSRYAPHPIEIRARAVDQAVAFLGGANGAGVWGSGEAVTQELLNRRIALVKTVAVHLEAFMAAAGQDQQTPHAASTNSQAAQNGGAA